MKKFGKLLVGITLGVSTVAGLVACGGNKQVSPSTQAPEVSQTPATQEPSNDGGAEIQKPNKITMMVDGTFTNVAAGQNEIVAKYKELTGIDLDITTVDHNAYYDQLSIAFASGIKQEVVILGASYYPAYAAQGALWDMSDAWENSELRASGRVNEAYIDALYMGDSLYGFSPASGNGCITYIRKDWLDRVGLSVPTTFDEYIEVLRVFTHGDPDGNGTDGDTYGVTAAGIMGVDAPFIHYLPEFWQDAYPDFYQQADGTWVDGFGEEKMVGALQRLKDAYQEGLIDMEVATNKTSTARDKFYASQVGVFTYWAGQWMMTLEQNTQAIEPGAEIVAIAPINEIGTYVERQAPVLAITPAASNPEGIFKYLFEFMLDGAEGQTLFTYGVENVHWEQSAEGLKHLPNMENPSNTFTKVYIDGVLSIGDWINGDPVQTRDERVVTSSDIFSKNSVVAPVMVSNDVKAAYAATLQDIRVVLLAEVVTGGLSVEEGMARYQQQAGKMVEEILASLN
jgi:putative aldouronate transport system substrate-binding protein